MDRDLPLDADWQLRLVPLEGGVNFRDLGGYEAADGRRVKWRHIYRSGTMGRLTEADANHLAQLGIRCVVDFRSIREQRHEPNRWCQAAGVTYWSRAHREVFGHLHDMVERGIESEAQAEGVMIHGFRHLPFQQAPAYAELLKRMADGEVPIAFNCTAGKDRTGGAAALVMAVLGVSRDAIAADFALTERAVDLRKTFGARPNDPASPYAKLSEEVMAALSGARPAYIAAFLDAIDEECGSLQGYLERLGITPAQTEAMRQGLLD